MTREGTRVITNQVLTRWLTVLVVAIGPVALLGAIQPAPPPTPARADSALRAAFEENYQKFKADCEKVWYSSSSYDRLSSPYYRAIVDMGLPALPLIMEKIAEDPDSPDSHWVSWASAEIARVTRVPDIYPWAAQDRELTWWAGGQKLANQRFEWAYGQWKAAKAAGRREDARKFLKTMCAIGFAALPPMMEKVSAGDAELLPVVRGMTSGAAVITGSTPQERTTACVAWWDKNKTTWLIPFPDQVALADAAPATGSPPNSSGGGTVAAPQEGVPSSDPAAAPAVRRVGRVATGVRTGGCGMRRS
jgi:hypothetical protein